MIEVELMDDGKEARDFNELLLEVSNKKSLVNLIKQLGILFLDS